MTPERRADLLPCDKCKKGWVHCYASPSYKCGKCNGTGFLEHPASKELAAIRAALRDVLPRVVCPACKGNGRVEMLEKCLHCDGTGTIDPTDGPETTLALVEQALRHRADATREACADRYHAPLIAAAIRASGGGPGT